MIICSLSHVTLLCKTSCRLTTSCSQICNTLLLSTSSQWDAAASYHMHVNTVLYTRPRIAAANKLTQAVLPLDHIGDEQNGQSQYGSSHCVDANGASKDPEAHSDSKSTSCDFFIQREGPQLLQLHLGLLGSIRSILHLCNVLTHSAYAAISIQGVYFCNVLQS